MNSNSQLKRINVLEVLNRAHSIQNVELARILLLRDSTTSVHALVVVRITHHEGRIVQIITGISMKSELQS